ncbi:hypothetical protein BDU57DRAFT_512574 [Ampelomyces quisqualis]|uniref:Uncharacterized protein n=1 Tax=Ampelomyces quisqualis TaxID=50730 RepID=A0A6A5QVF4_AMPQU|nr:hypothetical protein BDU57DRAFT_512574 [Ampelomyces quisqualis]
MGAEQYSQHAATPPTTAGPAAARPTSKIATSWLFWPLLVSNLLLSLLCIANLGLISSTIAWQFDQKHNVRSYTIHWPQTTFDLNVEPARLWVEQVHISLAAAAYGVLLGLFGTYVAWRIRRSTRPLKSTPTLLLLNLPATILTLSALVYVFVITYRTTKQAIRVPVAANIQGSNYGEFTWTPETWLTAVLDLPLADLQIHDEIKSMVAAMVAWRWMLVPIFIVEIIACGVTMVAWWKLRKGVAAREDADTMVQK